MAKRPDDEGPLPAWLRLVIALVVLALWGVSVVVQMTSKSYETPLLLHTIALSMFTFIFGREFGRAVRDRLDP